MTKAKEELENQEETLEQREQRIFEANEAVLFPDAHPEYYPSDHNYAKIKEFLDDTELPLTKENLEKAFEALTLLNELEKAPTPTPTAVKIEREPEFTIEELQRLPLPELKARARSGDKKAQKALGEVENIPLKSLAKRASVQRTRIEDESGRRLSRLRNEAVVKSY